MLYPDCSMAFPNAVPKGNEGISQLLVCNAEPMGFQPLGLLCPAADLHRTSCHLVVYRDSDILVYNKERMFEGLTAISFFLAEATMTDREPRAKG